MAAPSAYFLIIIELLIFDTYMPLMSLKKR